MKPARDREEEEGEEASFSLVSFIFSFPSSSLLLLLLLLRRVGIVFTAAPSISVSPSLSSPPDVGRLKGSSILTYYGGEGGKGPPLVVSRRRHGLIYRPYCAPVIFFGGGGKRNGLPHQLLATRVGWGEEVLEGVLYFLIK